MSYFKILLFLLVLTSCTSTSQFVKFAGDPTELTTGKAKIYVLRSGTMTGSAIKMPVYCNDEIIGKLGSKSYLCWEVEEGTYAIYTSTEGALIGKNATENKDFFTVKAKAGKTYYIEQNPKMGYMGYAKVSLSLLSDRDGKTMLAKLKRPKVNYAE